MPAAVDKRAERGRNFDESRRDAFYWSKPTTALAPDQTLYGKITTEKSKEKQFGESIGDMLEKAGGDFSKLASQIEAASKGSTKQVVDAIKASTETSKLSDEKTRTAIKGAGEQKAA
jgi:hypothetical protein